MRTPQTLFQPSQLPPGQYSAIVGGYVSEFKIKGVLHAASFPKGVRGFGIRDTVTVADDGISIHSIVLGSGGVLHDAS